MLKKMFGDKAAKDLKTLNPYAERVLEAEKPIIQLDNDGLRAKTFEFKQKIVDYISAEENEIKELKQRIENEEDISIPEKETMYANIDKLGKAIVRKKSRNS